MDPVSENIYSIIAKSLTDKLTDKEATDLERWKSESPENDQEYKDFVSIWVQSGSLKMPYAIDQLKAQNTISKKVDSQVSTRKWVHWATRAAAIFILSILLSGIYSYLNKGKNDSVYSSNSSQPIYQEVKAAYGTQAKVELADGTTVFLNSGSKLRFPLTFNNQNERKVILDGEGFFNVTKNTKHPFIVQTSQLNIKVLGTTFNVDAYTDNQTFHIALLEGNVVLQNQTDKRHESRMELSPNQVATLNLANNTLSKTNVDDLYKYTAWINGRIVFFGDPIQTIVKKLEKWYNVEIVISDKRLENYSFTGTFIDEPLEQILSILSLTSPMTFDIQPTRVQADNSISKRRIILKSKK